MSTLLTLVLLIAGLWLLSQTITQRSVIYGGLFITDLWFLTKTVNLKSAAACILLLLGLWIAVESPPVQTWLIKQATGRLSKGLHTTVSIQHVDFSFFNKMSLEGTLVNDQRQDTLLYAGQLKVRITDWFFLKDSAVLQYIGIQDAVIKLQRDDSVWNYQFIADYFSSPNPGSSKSNFRIDLKLLDLANIRLLKRDAWRGEDMNLRMRSLNLHMDELDFQKKIAHIQLLQIAGPDFSITNYDGKRPPLPVIESPSVKNDPKHLRWNPGGWDVEADHLVIDNGSFKNEKPSDAHPYDHFDGNHILFSAINLDFKKIKFRQDTVTAEINLSTNERSGLQVKKLSAQFRFFPEAMEFAKLDLQTNKSRLRNFFAMRFNSFDDMSDFVTKVSMDANFADSEIDSDDIAFFAPDAKTWKKNIRISGNIRGPVANLQGKNVLISAGRNTFLNGDIRLRGLPDIDKTYIDFKSTATGFKTTYADAIAFIPSLKTIDQPRIDKIDYLHFNGNFTGYIRDFVTAGTIETNLGMIESNVNMKIFSNQPAVYSGTITTREFDLGTFLANDQLGKLSFNGKIDGKGLQAKTVEASLDGTIDRLDFNNYTYTNLQIKGAVASRKFNGQLQSADSNFHERLNGLINFSGAQPRFDFNADVTNIDLRNLHFMEPDIHFNGKLRFNFTGDNIDNFMGQARIYEASLYKDGHRVSFDSLKLESSIADSNKTITLVSNEFDGAIVGEFAIRELPAAFQTFLNKYYPSYIKPAGHQLSHQNFSFVITTREVDEYMDLVDKRLKGFNNSTISGRIDNKENLLDLSASVPQFSYGKIALYNVNIKGEGNLDSLAMESTIGDIYVNDSLHFPSTQLHVRSFNDLSDIQVITSANQTLNSANISARVQTLSNGIHIKFNPSTFDINSKTWTIDKNGELSFGKDLLTAEALKISSSDQQVLISTHPSAEGSWNDINIDLKKINIGDFTPFFTKSERLEGLLTGNLQISDPFHKSYGTFKGTAEQFRFNNDSIGVMQLGARYNKTTGLVNATVHSDNKDYHFDANAVFNTIDTNATAPINITVPNIVDTKIDFLHKYLGEIFGNMTGLASGNFQVVGSGDHLKYLGKVHLRDAGMKVLYTQCYYKIAAADVLFADGYIDFGTIKIQDTLGNTGEIVRGKLYHQSFSDFRYDFELNTSRLLLLNTHIADNNQFYGTVIGKANLTLSGPNDNMIMKIKGEPVDSSNIYLPSTVSRESADAGFIAWKVYGKEMVQTADDRRSADLTVFLDLTANNYANVYVIIDPLTKDIIKANGHGNLLIKIGTNENMSITGRYEIDRGNYNFSFQSFIRKPFLLREGVGNYIQWTGKADDADIDIQAIYEAENVEFADLGLNSLQTFISNADKLKQYRGTVWVNATLTGKLMKPDIEFDLELPPNSELKNNPDAALLFQRIKSDPNELNKQVAFLVVFNSFGPLSNSTSNFNANTAFGGIVVSSISGAISNVFSQQFSNVFQKIFNDKSIRVNFNTSFYNGNPLDENLDQSKLNLNRTNLNLSVAKSFLNERLTFTFGSALDFGLTAQQAQASSFQFLPDINAEWKITPNGRFSVNFFYRDSYNYLSAGNHTQNSSGASLSYRRDFDRIDEVLKPKKKPKPKETPKPAPATSSE